MNDPLVQKVFLEEARAEQCPKRLLEVQVLDRQEVDPLIKSQLLLSVE